MTPDEFGESLQHLPVKKPRAVTPILSTVMSLFAGYAGAPWWSFLLFALGSAAVQYLRLTMLMRGIGKPNVIPVVSEALLTCGAAYGIGMIGNYYWPPQPR